MSFKIFYSWQSDLPSARSRSIIQDAIKMAVEFLGNEIEGIEADRDTQNTTGSPDIAETILAKIEDCDLFIADVTCVGELDKIAMANDNSAMANDINAAVNEGEVAVADNTAVSDEHRKKSPNPNVLLELGYASGILGWDRIICVINTDFGKIEELPFDIRSRRVTQFSLANKSKKDSANELKDIIVRSAFALKDKPKKSGRKDIFAKHKIYGYDYAKKELCEHLVPYNPATNKDFCWRIKKLQDECSSLVDSIKAIQLEPSAPIPIEKPNKYNLTDVMRNAGFASPRYVLTRLSDDEEAEIKEYLGEEVDDEFFDLGNLKQPITIFPSLPGVKSEPAIEGSDTEKQKWKLLGELKSLIHELKMYESLYHMIDDYHIFPLAIANESTKLDENIDISIEYEGADPLMLRDECGVVEHSAGIIYEKEMLKDFLYVEDSRIGYDTDITETIADQQVRKMVRQFGAISSVGYGVSDYERDVCKYLKRPDGGIAHYYITSLKAGEMKLLGAALLMRKDAGKHEVKYQIKSDQSDGNLCGSVGMG